MAQASHLEEQKYQTNCWVQIYTASFTSGSNNNLKIIRAYVISLRIFIRFLIKFYLLFVCGFRKSQNAKLLVRPEPVTFGDIILRACHSVMTFDDIYALFSKGGSTFRYFRPQ